MKKVFKYKLNYENVTTFLSKGASWEQQQIIELPAHSEVLHVSKQGDQLMLWVKVDVETNSKHNVGIEIVGTGHEIKNDDGKYLNTFLDGDLVMHVFVDYGMYTKNEKV